MRSRGIRKRGWQPFGDYRKLEERMWAYSWREWCRIAGICHKTEINYRRRYGDIPTPPCSKTMIYAFMARHNLPSPDRVGPSPSGEKVAAMRKQGMSYRAIAAELGIVVSNAYGAHQRWIAKQKRLKERKRRLK